MVGVLNCLGMAKRGAEVEKGKETRLSLTNIKLNCIAYRNRLRFLQSVLIVMHYYAIIML